VTVHVKELGNRRLVRFLKRTDRWCTFSWSICDKNCHFIRRIESNNFYGYVGIHGSWKDKSSEKEQWAKINIDKNRTSNNEQGCFGKSQNYYRPGDRTAELNIHLEDPVSTETNPTATVGL
jgi:hypothetical protein